MIDTTPDPKAILTEATREAGELIGLFGSAATERDVLFDAMDQHALTLRFAATKAGAPSVAQDMNRMWGDALLQRQLVRLSFHLFDKGFRFTGLDAYPAECKENGRLNVTAAMAHAFSVLIDAMERPTEEPA